MIWPLPLIERWRVMLADRRFPRPETDVLEAAGLLTPARHIPDLIARTALQIGNGEIGNGEIGGNNLGPHVAKYLAPSKPPLPWCAGFSGWCYQMAAADLGVALPFRRSLSARKLAANIAAFGRKFTDPIEANPGDVMLFARGPSGSSLGHVALVVEIIRDAASKRADVRTIEGNHSPQVARFVRRTDDPRFLFFASVRKAPALKRVRYGTRIAKGVEVEKPDI